MAKANTTLTDHGLWFEGAPHDERGIRIYGQGTGGTGRASCRCGEVSPVFESGYKRKAWHREHKASIRAMKEQAQ